MEQIVRNLTWEDSFLAGKQYLIHDRDPLYKGECLNHLVLSPEEQLRHVLSEYLVYYHHERIHQGLNRIIEPRHDGNHGEIICIERLGGLLKSYRRAAA